MALVAPFTPKLPKITVYRSDPELQRHSSDSHLDLGHFQRGDRFGDVSATNDATTRLEKFAICSPACGMHTRLSSDGGCNSSNGFCKKAGGGNAREMMDFRAQLIIFSIVIVTFGTWVIVYVLMSAYKLIWLSFVDCTDSYTWYNFVLTL